MASHSDVDVWIERQMPQLQPIVRCLDEVIRATIPGLQYAVKWKRPYYGLADLGWIIEIDLRRTRDLTTQRGCSSISVPGQPISFCQSSDRRSQTGSKPALM